MEKDEFFADARDDLTGPLAGVRVLEVTTTWAGPMAGVVLADLGADVSKVEIPSGDVARSLISVPVPCSLLPFDAAHRLPAARSLRRCSLPC